MKGTPFDASSMSRLRRVHPDLQKVALLAKDLSPLHFIITEGMRSEKRQRQLYNSGGSTTMNSRHLTGHAIDIAPKVGGKISWDWPLFYKLEEAFKQAAVELGFNAFPTGKHELDRLEWGGDWEKLKDGPHWQLSWRYYPK